LPVGIKIFQWMNALTLTVLDAASAGSRFLFGRLALAPGVSNAGGEGSLGFFLAFQALPTIIFFSALMSILYHLKIMPKIIQLFARLFTKLMKVSGAESLCATSNIFVGIESVLTVKPYLKKMTASELCTILTAGMATVSSNILAVYVFSLQKVFPNIAGHLISASLLSAPAALAISKILIPESDSPRTLGENVEIYHEGNDNLFDAVISGAESGVKIIVGISALLIAVLGLVELVDTFLGWLGAWVNNLLSLEGTWSLTAILKYVFYPFVLFLGVPLSDVGIVAELIGSRLVLTEVTAYVHLSEYISSGVLTDARSIVITTYALCGFAHVASLSIFIGGISGLIPELRLKLTKIGFRALIAANLACLMTACMAGVFYTQNTMLLFTK
ncbi:MAG: nucleoside transporter, partial [Candidatus Omnitrophica bacterium]|nr:nucleoside transporter [Candidatus Omnitrophota bacterium]